MDLYKIHKNFKLCLYFLMVVCYNTNENKSGNAFEYIQKGML